MAGVARDRNAVTGGTETGVPGPRALVAALSFINESRGLSGRQAAARRELLANATRRLAHPQGSRHPPEETAALAQFVEELLDHPSNRLAVYGTLAPGDSNHHVVADIPGRWTKGWVRGRLVKNGPYPALRWDPEGPRVPVRVLHSTQLDHQWARLDRFEGVQYRRILVSVETAAGTTIATNLYEGLRAP